MQNRLEDRPPPLDQPVLRIQALAADLAYGALRGMWEAELPADNANLKKLYSEKWSGSPPDAKLLISFGYLEDKTTNPAIGNWRYILTQKAFELLETIPPNTHIFISYGRRQSSALGLAVQYKLLSLEVDAFLDRDLDPGEEWHARLEVKVKQCDYFICLLAPKNTISDATLASRNVIKEVRWAWESNRMCIPFWHPSFHFVKDDIPNYEDFLGVYLDTKNAIRVHEESAEGYHDAINKLLNKLGRSEL